MRRACAASAVALAQRFHVPTTAPPNSPCATPSPPELSNVKKRPVYLDLPRIRLPLPGIVSILHRVSGALLFLFGIPLLLAGVGTSLASPDAYAQMKAIFAHPAAKLALLVMAWAFLHHFCAGIRYLLLDIEQGVELVAARRSSVIVIAVSVVLTLVVGARLW